MNRNQFNLLAVLAILIIVTVSCVYRSSRNSQPSNAPSNEVKTETSGEPKPSKSVENKKTDKGDFVVKHLEVSNSRYNEIDRQIKEEKLLEKAADKLNRSLILPYDIDLITKDCGEVNAFYDADKHSVTVC